MIGVVVLAVLEAQVLTLQEAEQRARQHHPAVIAARSAAAVAEGRALEGRASLLPQVMMTASYRYATGNRTVRIGTPPALAALRPPSTVTVYDYGNFALTASQLLYDFGQTSEAWRAEQLAAQSATLDAHAQELAALLDVRLAFFTARARRELLDVAAEDLANQQHHLEQVQGLIDVNIRPAIDLVQARAGVGAAELRRIAAQNDYALARAELDRAMGETEADARDLAADELPALPGESGFVGRLLDAAARARPDLLSSDRQIESGQRALISARAAYAPAFHLTLSLTDAGPLLDPGPLEWGNLRWNYQGALVLTWPLFEGGRTRARVREADASVAEARAHRQLLDVELRAELERARLSVVSAKAAITVSETTTENARERLRLADGRYKAGVGTALEVSDAQLAYVSAAAQRVQARFALSTARAQLLHAIGEGP